MRLFELKSQELAGELKSLGAQGEEGGAVLCYVSLYSIRALSFLTYYSLLQTSCSILRVSCTSYISCMSTGRRGGTGRDMVLFLE